MSQLRELCSGSQCRALHEVKDGHHFPSILSCVCRGTQEVETIFLLRASWKVHAVPLLYPIGQRRSHDHWLQGQLGNVVFSMAAMCLIKIQTAMFYYQGKMAEGILGNSQQPLPCRI